MPLRSPAKPIGGAGTFALIVVALMVRPPALHADTCSFTLGSTSQNFDASGGTGTVTVTSSPDLCAFSAVSHDEGFITITSITSNAVNYSVSPNSGPARIGSMGIAGQTFTVSQASASNTPAGANVSVQLGPISAFFTNVVTPGNTVVGPEPPPIVPPNPIVPPDPILPPGFKFFSPTPPPIMPGFSVDVSTTAAFSGPITLVFDLGAYFVPPSPITPQQFSSLRVLHGETLSPNGPPIFVDRTVPPSPIVPPNPIVPPSPIMPLFASVTSLSPFVIAQMSDKVVFSSTRDGNLEIYTMNSDGTGVTRLTNNPASDVFPAWSPDRSKIAFTSNRSGQFEIYTMNADGSSPTRLTFGASVNGGAAWSPDGLKIAFTSNRDGNFEIYSMNPDGTGLARLTNNPGADFKPTWSPDATRIAFTSTRDGLSHIYVMNADGTGVTRLTSGLQLDSSPAWSPDGRRIAFASNRGSILNFEIFVMNADGSSPVKLTSDPALDGEPGWSPDGAKIVFSSNRSGLLNFQIYAMNADGTGQTRLTSNRTADASPQW